MEAYGDRVDDVLALVPAPTLASQQSSETKWESEKVVPNFPYLKCEVVYSVRHEWAQTLEVTLGAQRSARTKQKANHSFDWIHVFARMSLLGVSGWLSSTPKRPRLRFHP